MRVGVSVLGTDGRLRGFAGRAAGGRILRSGCRTAAIAATLLLLPATPTRAETLPEVLVRTYQGNPVLNAERARLRGIDETVPMAVSAYRPQIMAMLSGGLQAVRVPFPDKHRADRHADLVQRLQDCKQGAPVRSQRAVGARGLAQCRPGGAVQDPANVRGVKDLLGHSSFGTTEKHYSMAQSRLAGRALARAIVSTRK
jgi:hypothetical protein